MEVWLKQNTVGLLIGASALVAVYTETAGDIRVLKQELIEAKEHTTRFQTAEMDLLEIKTQYNASKDYWLRFEKVLGDNSKVLNSAVQTFSKFDVQLQDHERRIERLEK